MYIYTVQAGDNIYSIASRFGVTQNSITEANQITNPQNLVIGQNLIIPVESIRYRVMAGQTLYSIANSYNITVQDILNANTQITNPSNIYVGQIITIPLERAEKRTIDVNGYVFPNVSTTTLQTTLPYLTYISIFSNQINRDGSITQIEDSGIIDRAKSQNVAPIMVLTNIIRGGSFSGSLANSILGYDELQDTVIENLVKILGEKGYAGVNIDFEYIYTSDLENYNRFLRKLSRRLRALGYIITTAVAPKVSANQVGTLYEAHDYVTHGEIADKVIIMTYEWGFTFSEPMAVAPINKVERVLQYAVSNIPSEKILMGMPNYGYDWTLPYVQGSRAMAISNKAAIELATRVGAIIEYDETVQSPYFYYYDNDGSLHIVWFDDARSIQARLRLIEKYNLGGVSYWTINSLFRPNWEVLSSMYNINKIY